MRPSLRFICSAVLTATSTILAILFTLISFSKNIDYEIKSEHYKRVKWIARLCTATFIAAVILLMSLSLPLEESNETLHSHYEAIYYSLLVYSALMGGMMISIILMLYAAASALIMLAHPEREATSLLRKEKEEKKRGKNQQQELL